MVLLQLKSIQEQFHVGLYIGDWVSDKAAPIRLFVYIAMIRYKIGADIGETECRVIGIRHC